MQALETQPAYQGTDIELSCPAARFALPHPTTLCDPHSSDSNSCFITSPYAHATCNTMTQSHTQCIHEESNSGT
jgi:hypothetical protein